MRVPYDRIDGQDRHWTRAANQALAGLEQTTSSAPAEASGRDAGQR